MPVNSASAAFPMPGFYPIDPEETLSESRRERFASEPRKGMTLRDYFAAHAPAEPQEWFVPVVAPFPIHPKLDDYGVTFAQYQPLGGDTVFEGRPEDVERFKTALSEHRNDLEKWRLERQKQCYIQWPYAWADAVLAASEGK